MHDVDISAVASGLIPIDSGNGHVHGGRAIVRRGFAAIIFC